MCSRQYTHVRGCIKRQVPTRHQKGGRRPRSTKPGLLTCNQLSGGACVLRRILRSWMHPSDMAAATKALRKGRDQDPAATALSFFRYRFDLPGAGQGRAMLAPFRLTASNYLTQAAIFSFASLADSALIATVPLPKSWK